jgi:hypothetical protein
MKTTTDLAKLQRLKAILEDINYKSMPVGLDWGDSDVADLSEEGLKIVSDLMKSE